jgi:lipopolysaccharide export system permease protein
VRIINRYLTQDFLVAFALTLTIFTLVMCIGIVIKAIDLASRGLSGALIAKVFFYQIPYMMTFTIPVSTLTTVLLLFGRLSFDGELSAMKASGLSMWQIISPVVILSIVLSAVCAVIGMSVAPVLKYKVEVMLRGVGILEPVKLVEAGRFIRDFPNLTIYVGRRDGNKIEDVVVYELDPKGLGPVRNVRAKRGEVHPNTDSRILKVDLYDVRIDQRERDKATGVTKSHYINAEHYPVTLDFSSLVRKPASKRASTMTWLELARTIRDIRSYFPEVDYADLLKQRMRFIVEANGRMSLALSCFAFTLLGIPLGIKSKRRESAVGVVFSLLVVFVYFSFVVAAKTLAKYPDYHADLLVWVPIIAMEIGGFLLIRRAN